MSFVKKNLQSIILTTLLAIQLFWLNNPLFGLIIGVLYISHLLNNKQGTFFAYLSSFIKNLSIIIITGTILYYIFNLQTWSIFLTLFIPILLKPTTHTRISLKKIKVSDFKIYLPTIIYIILTTILFILLFNNQSQQAIVSPWQILPSYFFIIYFLSTSLIIYILINKERTTNILLIILHTFLSSSIVLILYKIGYGFDPFIHRTTQEYILQHGAIYPKTPYYIGQYSLVVVLTKILSVPLSLIDKILVPLLGSIIIPTATYLTLIKLNIKQNISSVITLVTSFLLLFTIFFTVPQHLANILLVIFVLSSLLHIKEKVVSQTGLFILSITIFLIHPLAGIPAILTSFLILIRKIPNNKIKNILTTVTIIVSCIAIPLAFIVAGYILPNFSTSIDLSNLKTVVKSQIQSFNYLPFHSYLHTIYFLKEIYILCIVALGLAGAFIAKKRHPKTLILFSIPIILITNSYLLHTITFDQVINYEQNIFPQRLIHFAFFFTLPFILLSLNFLLNKILTNKKNTLITVSALSILLISIFYTTYPTYDRIEKNKGYAVSENDIQTVLLIDKLSNDDNYVVLANQSTAAAALQEFGFKKYYKTPSGPLFYYPIPTSSPLYQVYLDITYKGVQDNLIQQARDISGANTVYLVVSDYWTNSKQLIKQGSITSKENHNIDEKIWIFKF